MNKLPIWTVDDTHIVRVTKDIALYSELRFNPKYGATGRVLLSLWSAGYKTASTP